MPFRCNRVRSSSVKTSATITKFLARIPAVVLRRCDHPHLRARPDRRDGAISGFVVDTSGAALSGAVVQVRNTADGTTRRATTQTKGEFLVPNLPAGDYTVAVDYALFARLTLTPVVVEVGATTTVEARLRLGTVSTTVNVTAEPAVAVNVGETSSRHN